MEILLSDYNNSECNRQNFKILSLICYLTAYFQLNMSQEIIVSGAEKLEKSLIFKIYRILL